MSRKLIVVERPILINGVSGALVNASLRLETFRRGPSLACHLLLQGPLVG